MASFYNLVGDDCKIKLEIPCVYARILGLVVHPREVILQNVTDGEWKARLEEEEGKLFFKTGWAKFAEENNVEPGDMVVVECDGYITYKVMIFGRTKCHKVMESLKINPTLMEQLGKSRE